MDTAAIYHLFFNITKRENLLNLPTVFRGMMGLHVQIIVCKLFSFKNCWMSIILSQCGVQDCFFMFITLKNFSEVPARGIVSNAHTPLRTAEIWRKIYFFLPWNHFYHSIGMIDKSFELYIVFACLKGRCLTFCL